MDRFETPVFKTISMVRCKFSALFFSACHDRDFLSERFTLRFSRITTLLVTVGIGPAFAGGSGVVATHCRLASKAEATSSRMNLERPNEVRRVLRLPVPPRSWIPAAQPDPGVSNLPSSFCLGGSPRNTSDFAFGEITYS